MDATPFAAVFEDVVVVYDASSFTAYVAVAVRLNLLVKSHISYFKLRFSRPLMTFFLCSRLQVLIN